MAFEWYRLGPVLERQMTGRPGSVVVLDGKNGAVGAHHDLSRAAHRLVRPGSTVKPFTLAALLDSGRLDRRTRLVCEGRLRVAGRRLDCVHPASHLPLDPAQAIAFSCNWYFARAAIELSPDLLASTFERVGLSSRTGLLPDEVSGIVRRAGDGDQVRLQALGESSVEVTPLGLAAAYRRLAQWMAERPDRLGVVKDGLLGCTAYGTGQLAGRGPLVVAGKTGTATSRGGAWTHGWFAGFAPVWPPEIVVVVFLEQGQGGVDAAPIAGAVFEAFAGLRSQS